MRGLALDRAPPLTVTLPFLVTPPVAMIVGGALLAWLGSDPLRSAWAPATAALTHVVTLLVLTVAMLGAIQQIGPVVAGVTLPMIRIQPVLHGLFVLGAAAFVVGVGLQSTPPLAAGAVLLATSIGSTIGPALWAFVRSDSTSDTVVGITAALVSFVATVVLGLLLAYGRATLHYPTDRAALLQAHVVFALFGWIGMLTAAVTAQVLPMFYLSPQLSRRVRHGVLAGATLGLVGAATALVVKPQLVPYAAIPAVGAVWGVQPVAALFALRKAKRAADPTWWFMAQAHVVALVSIGIAVISVTSADGRWPVLLGWLALWGWAGAMVHGMLYRIVPFLVWLQQTSARFAVAGPSVRELLPDSIGRVGLSLHTLALLLGAATIASQRPWLGMSTGLAIFGTGAVLLTAMGHVAVRSR